MLRRKRRKKIQANDNGSTCTRPDFKCWDEYKNDDSEWMLDESKFHCESGFSSTAKIAGAPSKNSAIGKPGALKFRNHRRVYGSALSKSSVVTDDSSSTGTMGKTDATSLGGANLSSILPILLHAREIGVIKNHARYQPRIPFMKTFRAVNCIDKPSSWKSLLLRRAASAKSSDDGGRDEKQPGHKRDLAAIYSGNHTDVQLHRWEWRPYSQQHIPFSKLKTPLSDAVLAVDRMGSYLISIGGDTAHMAKHSEAVSSFLSLRFYGVPSPAKLLHGDQVHPHSESYATVVSPLFLSIPLLLKNSGSIENRNFPAPSSLLGHNEFASPAAETPVHLLFSDDCALGVAFLHHSTKTAWTNPDYPSRSTTFSVTPALQDEDILSTIVIFETPLVSRNKVSVSNPDSLSLTRSFRCANVRVGGWSSFTMRNLLWPTTFVPYKKRSINLDGSCKIMIGNKVCDCSEALRVVVNPSFCLCDGFRKVRSAYILFNDEDDGFRITWATTHENSFEHQNLQIPPFSAYMQQTSCGIQPTRRDILVSVEENVWEMCLSDSRTGHVYEQNDSNKNDCSGLNIVYEAYLRIDALLIDILDRRHSLLKMEQNSAFSSAVLMPNFFYNLISVSQDGLRAVIVIVFSNNAKSTKTLQSAKKVPLTLGVFISFNLYDQSYDELKWVQHYSCENAYSMKQWCNSLALNWRMKECHVGVFCLDKKKLGSHYDNWVGRTHEGNFDEDLDDDFNVDLWSHFVGQKSPSKKMLSSENMKDISMSSLYSHCDVITNRAVYNAVPIHTISSRCSPIVLNYG